jgi:omega-6 fatty acid desaturase (delta-12 desaturase)
MDPLRAAHAPDAVDARQIQEDISRFQQATRLKSIWQLVNSLVPYAGLWYLAYEALRVSFWLALPVTIIASGFLIRIFIIFHDCGHGSFFRSKRANDFWGVVTGIITFTPYHYWRANHARHHATSGNLDKRGQGDVWMMTVTEYLSAPFKLRLQYRLYRNPLIMFLLGPLFILLITHRIVRRNANRFERWSVHYTNLGIVVVGIALSLLMGVKTYLILQGLILYIGFIAGVWLFYVQHQFEDVYWERNDNWDFVTASLDGGSFYRLPAVLRWFSGNIGYHHIHHLNPRVPNYHLDRCQRQVSGLDRAKTIGLFASLRALNYRLWDEESSTLVGFGEVRRRRRSLARAEA